MLLEPCGDDQTPGVGEGWEADLERCSARPFDMKRAFEWRELHWFRSAQGLDDFDEFLGTVLPMDRGWGAPLGGIEMSWSDPYQSFFNVVQVGVSIGFSPRKCPQAHAAEAGELTFPSRWSEPHPVLGVVPLLLRGPASWMLQRDRAARQAVAFVLTSVCRPWPPYHACWGVRRGQIIPERAGPRVSSAVPPSVADFVLYVHLISPASPYISCWPQGSIVPLCSRAENVGECSVNFSRQSISAVTRIQDIVMCQKSVSTSALAPRASSGNDV